MAGGCSEGVLVDLGLCEPLGLGAPVLEPDLDLGLGEVEAEREVESLAHGEVASRLELVLEADQLLVGEGCPRPPWLAASPTGGGGVI